jgi:hypothetical protein
MVKYRRWTQGAVECYSRGCVCQGCELFEILGKNCKMKKSVLSLITDLGKPPDDFEIPNNFNKIIDDSKIKVTKGEVFMFDEDLNLRYGNALAPLIEAVKKGYTDYSDLARETGTNRKTLSVFFSNFRACLIRQRLIKGHQDKTQKQSVIDFIKSRLLDKDYTEFNSGEAENVQEDNKKVIAQEFLREANPQPTLQERCNNLLERLEQSQKENSELRSRISELENQPKQIYDFDKIRHQIQSEIDQLTAKIKALDILEGELV